MYSRIACFVALIKNKYENVSSDELFQANLEEFFLKMLVYKECCEEYHNFYYKSFIN
jgi:hypothetical protein